MAISKYAKYETQLEAIRKMGFSNDELSFTILEQHKGDLQRSVLALLQISQAERDAQQPK